MKLDVGVIDTIAALQLMNNLPGYFVLQVLVIITFLWQYRFEAWIQPK